MHFLSSFWSGSKFFGDASNDSIIFESICLVSFVCPTHIHMYIYIYMYICFLLVLSRRMRQGLVYTLARPTAHPGWKKGLGWNELPVHTEFIRIRVRPEASPGWAPGLPRASSRNSLETQWLLTLNYAVQVTVIPSQFFKNLIKTCCRVQMHFEGYEGFGKKL